MSRSEPRTNLPRMGRQLARYPFVCLFLILFFTATGVHAQTPGYQEYYVLGYEEHVWQAFNQIIDGGPVPDPICSTVSLVATTNHQVIYYDHWEDGYEADLLHPIQSSTEVYTLTVGASLSLISTQPGAPDPKNQPVNVDPQRDPSEIRYDGGDRIITSGGPVALTHMMWPLNNSWVGGAWEIYSLEAYADTYSYHVPIGEDLYTFGGGDTGTYGDFRNVYLEIAAFEDNTTISIDNYTDTVNLSLNRGQSYSSLGYINSTSTPSITINVGTTIRSNNPVQVGLITGSDGAFQGRFLIVLPDEHSGADYVVPVPSGNPPAEAEVYLSNPNDFPITVHAYDAVVPYTSFVISPTGHISATVPYSEKRGGSYVPADSAARFTSSDGVFGVVVCADTSDTNYDWGFSGIPSKFLTRDYYVSWAPGDYNIPPQNNGSPVWVTPLGDRTTFFVDYSPLDGIVDQTFALNILDQRRIFDPDLDNTGMHVWATGEFAATWGEDPRSAGADIPYLDLGYSVLPPLQQWLDPVLTLDKTAEPTALPPTGGTVTFTLVARAHDGPIVNISITDTLPISWVYVPDHTTIQYPDGSTVSLDPVISDQTLSWDLQTTLDVMQSLTLTFQAQITTAGSVGAAMRDGFESQTYTAGDNWPGSWQETGEGDGPLAGGVTITDTTPFLGDYHLSIVSATRSLSRTVDLSEFTSPVLRFARHISTAAASEYYLDVQTETGWATVLTWTNSNLQGAYIQETAGLTTTDAAIRFRSGDSIGAWDHLYVDEVEIYDAIATNTNKGEVTGQLQYAGTDLHSTSEVNVAIGPLKVVKSVNATNVRIKDTLVYTLSYVNLSDSFTATNVVLYDAIPIQYVTFQSASNGGTFSGASGTITWMVGTLEPGGSGSVTFTVVVNNFVEDGTAIKNTAYIVSAQTEAAGSNTVRTSVQAPDIAFTKSGPTAAMQGQAITYTLSYENTGGAQATGVVIWDVTPVSTTYVAGSMAILTGSDWITLSDAAGDDLGTYLPISSTLVITPGNVAAGEAGMIRFNVRIDQGLSPGSLIRNWAVLDRDMDIPRESNLAVTRISELLINKSVRTVTSSGGSGTAVAPGGLITYFLTYENVSTTTAQTNVYVREPIPDYTRFVTASGAISYSWNYGAEWSATEPITPITHIRWHESSLPTTTRRVVSFTVQANNTFPSNTSIENIAYISSTQTAIHPGGWIPSNRVEVKTVDLWLEKRANLSLVGAGGAVSYAISYANRGSTDALGVQILDTIPTNTQYIPGSIYGTGSDASGNPSLTWDVMTVTAGASAHTVGYAVTLGTDLIPGITITNTAVLSSAYGLEASDPASITVASSADLAILKFAEHDTINVGDRLTYTVVISNAGLGSAFEAVVSDTFSTRVQLVPNSISLEPPGAGTTGTDLPILADGITITGGQRLTVTFAVTIVPPVPDGTIITNTVSITSTYTPTPTTASVTTTVHSPIFTLTKQATPGNWSRRIKLTFTNTQQAENLIDFPVLVVLDSSRIDYTSTQDAGQDIRFFDADNATRLAHEIEEWNESDKSYVWVRVPQIDGSSNSDYIWMYYGNPDAPDEQDPPNVWTADYRMVYHLAENPNLTGGVIRDSTANSFDATNQGSTDVAGIVGNAEAFSGINQYIDLGQNLAVINGVGATTLSAWIRPDTLISGGNILGISRYNSGSSTGNSRASIAQANANVQIFARSLDTDDDYHDNATTTSPLSAGAWHHVAAVIDYANDAITIYVNGAPQAISGIVDFDSPTTPDTNSASNAIGSNDDGSAPFFDGIIDEARVAATVRSADWITAQHKSMSDGFIAYGSEELVSVVSGTPFTYTITITNASAGIATNVVVTDTLPAGANYISGGSFILSSNTVSWTIPIIGANDSDQLTVAVSTCLASLNNMLYKVITSTQKVDSPPGPVLLTALTPPLLDAQFTYNPVDINIGDTVYFTDTSTTDGGPIVIRHWDFGDGDTASDPVVTHVYPNPGTYTVTLAVTDTCGFADVVTGTLSVYEPVLAVTKQAARPVVRAGETLQYNIIISNTGQGLASGVLVSDTLPAHTSFVDATPAAIGPLNGVITWSLGTLDAGATQPITVFVRVDSATISGTLITNTVSVTSAQGITATDAVTTSVGTAANLAVTKSNSPGLFLPGETLTYTLTYVNYGPSDAQDVTITDTLPMSVTYGSIVSSALPDPVWDGQSLTWHTPTLTAGDSGTIVFTVAVGADASQTITNTVVITSATPDPNLSNNEFYRVTRQFPVVNFASASFSAGESDGSAIVTVMLNYPFTSPVTVAYQTTTGGTATPGIDYVPTSDAVTIPAWTTSQTFTISILPDLLDEDNETVVLSLTGTSTGTFGTIYNPAILTIIDDDPPPNLSIDDAAVSEGDSGSVDAVFALSLDAVSGRTVRVDYVTGDNTATAPADYDAVATTTLSFAPGETAKQITVTVRGDTLVEGDETYLVNLTYVANATATDLQAIGTIIDDDTATVSIVPQDDGAEPGTDGHFIVTLTDRVATPLIANYVVSGTASNGIDYALLSGSVTIPANAVSTTITVNVTDDPVVESAETVYLTLISTDNPRVSVDLANDEAAITITDNDTASVSVATQNDGAEPSTDGRFVLSLSNPVAADLTVDYIVSGTATNGTDYTTLPGSVVIPAYSLTLPLTVAVIDDTVYEGDETVQIALTVTSNPQVSVGTPASATMTIVDDEELSVDFASNAYVVGESDGAATITVTLSYPAPFPITFGYQTATGGTATPGSDYTAVSGSLAFPAMVTNRTFAVPIISDLIDEPAETVVLTLTGATSATLATTNNPAILTIIDDDELVVDFASATYDGNEAIGTATITVSLNTTSTWQTAKVDYATSDGTATAPDDYAAVNGTLTFAPGVAQFAFAVPIVDDGLYEGPETVYLELSSPVSATVGTTNNPATLTIWDDISGIAIIRGTVFEDVNGNGLRDGSEAGFPDVLVTLDGTITTTTGATGEYVFSTVIIGAHTVVETDPRALALTGFPRAPTSAMDEPDYISTTPNQVNVSVTLGNVYQVNFGDAMTDMGFGVIYGIAFEDADGDGVQDITEMGISDVSITLDQAPTVATDLNGSYTLSTTVPRVHTVAATQPSGYFATTPPQARIDVVLGIGYQINFGNASTSASFAAIYGTVFGDENANGAYNANETGLFGVSIMLDGGPAVATGPYGGYTFATTTPGTHVVLETDPNGYSSTTPNMGTVSVTPGNGYQVDFGDMEITTCDPDLYEHDDTPDQARTFIVGTNQVRQFCDDAIDWVRFAATANMAYTITAFSWGQRADTILTLFDTDTQTPLAENDDYLTEPNDGSSRIIWQAAAEGLHYVRIVNQRDLTGQRTDYDLRIEGQDTHPSFILLPIVMRGFR